MITRDGEWRKMAFFWVVWLGRETGGRFSWGSRVFFLSSPFRMILFSPQFGGKCVGKRGSYWEITHLSHLYMTFF